MKLTMAKCPDCDRRDNWTFAEHDPVCGDCGAVMERTSRNAHGRWHQNGVELPRPWRAPYDLHAHLQACGK